MSKYGILAICLMILNGCFNNSNKINTAEKKVLADSFFPVTSYIKGQIIVLDSLPVTPLQITTIKGKSDSVWITKNDLKKILSPFLSPTINETNLVIFSKKQNSMIKPLMLLHLPMTLPRYFPIAFLFDIGMYTLTQKQN